MPYNGGEDNKHSSEVVNASDCSGLDDPDNTEANSFLAVSDGGEKLSKSHVNHKRNKNMGSEDELITNLKGPLLPSEVPSSSSILSASSHLLNIWSFDMFLYRMPLFLIAYRLERLCVVCGIMKLLFAHSYVIFSGNVNNLKKNKVTICFF